MIVQPALQAHAERQIRNFLRTRRQPHFVGASEVGMCLRRIKFSKLTKIPVDGVAEGWGASQRGTTFENHYWVPAMRKHYGKNLLYAGKDQRSMVYGQLRATPDGLLIHQKRDALKDLGINDIGPSGEIVLDCKSIDPRINLSRPKVEHEFQSQIQMALLRITTKHKPDYAVISYVNASFYDDVVEFAVEYDPEVYATAKDRALQVRKAKSADELPPEGWIAGGKECEYCPFADPCRKMRGDIPPVSKTDNIDRGLLGQIVMLAREERRWCAKASGITDEQRKIQHAIKELLRSHGLNKVEHDGVTVIWSPVKGRISFDMVGIRAAAARLGLNIQNFETVGEPTDRLVITEK